jgi:2-C-methyl-D-erythritol 2,4-cyclodiphosphate synthase
MDPVMDKIFFSAIGQDSHRFAPDGTQKPLMLGGVSIPDTPGLDGNSDADVILHAICNALSGLSGVAILGKRTDYLCKEKGIADSAVYVREALATLDTIKLVHLSITVEARQPCFQGVSLRIRESVAELVGLPVEHVGLTATSGEGLTAFGKGEGISVFVIASAYKTVAGPS